jgi:3-isopropylmalate/(R)-2-methylmalate dehydratase small subunit
MKTFGGEVLFLDRGDINTDEIIPAKYLNENSRAALKPFLLEDLKLAGFDPKRDISGKGAVVSRANFGCGSSREHAPWALEANNINIVIAESFARIFRQNMYNCGMIACELPASALNELFAEFAGKKTLLTVDTAPDLQGKSEGTLTFKSGEKERTFSFTFKDFEKALVEAGGWVEYAAQKY